MEQTDRFRQCNDTGMVFDAALLRKLDELWDKEVERVSSDNKRLGDEKPKDDSQN